MRTKSPIIAAQHIKCIKIILNVIKIRNLYILSFSIINKHYIDDHIVLSLSSKVDDNVNMLEECVQFLHVSSQIYNFHKKKQPQHKFFNHVTTGR